MADRQQSKGENPRKSGLLTILLAVSAVVALVNIFFVVQTYKLLEADWREYQTAKLDNVQTNVMRLEIDALAFEARRINYGYNPTNENRIAFKTAHDVLRSRVDVLASMINKGNFPAWSHGLAEFPPIRQIVLDMTSLFALSPDQFQENRGRVTNYAADLLRQVRHFTNGIADDLNEQAMRNRLAVLTDIKKILLSAMMIEAFPICLVIVLFVLWRRLKKSNVELDHISEKFWNIFRAADAGVLITDGHGLVREWSDSAERLFRFTAEEAGGANIGAFLDCDILPRELRLSVDRANFQSSEGVPSTVAQVPPGQARRADGTTFAADVVYKSIGKTDADRLHIFFVRDTTAEREHNEALRRSRDAAIEAERGKARFLGMVSHEMRTPLSGLLAATEFLSRLPKTNKRQARLIEVAQDCAQVALAQVNDILDLTRLDLASEHEAVSAFDVIAMTRNIVDRYRPLGSKGGNTLVDALGSVPALFVKAEKRCYERALGNLLSNALKFTHDGTVTVALELLGPVTDRARIRVSVADTGPGIAPEHVTRIFNDFETLPNGSERTVPGAGLGLGIAQRSVRRLGGRIDVESTIGLGSTFSFRLDLPVVDGLPADQVEPTNDTAVALRRVSTGAALRVLIAEDDDASRFVLSEILADMGCTVQGAENGEEALQLAQAMVFDVIFMDINMPGTDGTVAAREIRKGAASAGALIVGMTAYAEEQQFSELVGQVFDQLHLKPMSLETIETIVFEMRRDELGGKPGHDAVGATGKYLNSEALADLAMHIPAKRLREIIESFLTDVTALVEQVTTRPTGPVTRNALHQIIGSASMMGASDLRLRAIAMQTALASGQADDVTRACKELRTSREKTEKALRQFRRDAGRLLPAPSRPA